MQPEEHQQNVHEALTQSTSMIRQVCLMTFIIVIGVPLICIFHKQIGKALAVAAVIIFYAVTGVFAAITVIICAGFFGVIYCAAVACYYCFVVLNFLILSLFGFSRTLVLMTLVIHPIPVFLAFATFTIGMSAGVMNLDRRHFERHRRFWYLRPKDIVAYLTNDRAEPSGPQTAPIAANICEIEVSEETYQIDDAAEPDNATVNAEVPGVPNEPNEIPAGDSVICGNTRSKRYYLPSDKQYSRVLRGKNTISFDTEEMAIEAGYTRTSSNN